MNAEQAAKRIDTAARQPALREMCHRSIRLMRIPKTDRCFEAKADQLARVGHIDEWH